MRALIPSSRLEFPWSSPSTFARVPVKHPISWRIAGSRISGSAEVVRLVFQFEFDRRVTEENGAPGAAADKARNNRIDRLRNDFQFSYTTRTVLLFSLASVTIGVPVFGDRRSVLEANFGIRGPEARLTVEGTLIPPHKGQCLGILASRKRGHQQDHSFETDAH